VFSVNSNPLDEREIAIAFQGQNDGGVYSTLTAAELVARGAPSTRFSDVRSRRRVSCM
jgi:hypothetical protein